MKTILYDATLREGAQGAGTSFSVDDKLKIVKLLDDLCVDYIEAGNPGSNPKDKEFFKRMENISLKNSKLVAFGSTCRLNKSPEADDNIKALLDAKTSVVAIFGKAWDFHVTDILKISLEENLKIIKESIEYLVACGKEVIFDAEHFFDGFKNNEIYAMKVLKTAKDAGASWLVLCDTNGGCFPNQIADITKIIVCKYENIIGIHVHNDTGMADANTITSIQNGATMLQVTINGIGERCGNADLTTVVPDLQLKLGYDIIPAEKMKSIYTFSKQFAEIANISMNTQKPYVGKNAFTHKAGMHIDGVNKNPISFEHVDPSLVGRSRAFILSEVAGRVAVINKAKTVLPGLDKNAPEAALILEKLKELEYEGYQFEGAEASFELMIKKLLGLYEPEFEISNYKIVTDFLNDDDENYANAIAEVKVGDQTEINAAKGYGPVNALDGAIRKALERFYPQLKQVHLTDYKVRVLDSKRASASKVRVLVESTDGTNTWNTIGVSHDIIAASYIALKDSIEYKLLMQK